LRPATKPRSEKAPQATFSNKMKGGRVDVPDDVVKQAVDHIMDMGK